MVRRQRVLLVLGTIGFLAAIACGIPGVCAQQSRVAKPEQSASKARPNAPARLMRGFGGTHEEARQKELDNIERFHLDETGLAPALRRAIEPLIFIGVGLR